MRASVFLAGLAGLVSVVSVALLGCSRKIPDNVKPVLEAQRATAIKVADSAGALCPLQKGAAPFNPNPMAAPPSPPSPARGTSLEAEKKVIDVFVMCNWPDPRSRDTAGGTALSSLRGTSHVPVRPVTMPDDVAETTCKKNPHDCIQVVTPSRHVKSEQSADLQVVRPISDGGWVEVTVILADPP